MKTQEVRKLSAMDRLIYWIKERESIRLQKESGEAKPWTDDEILQSYRFCNVRRMDDKVSRWLLENWYQPFFNHPNMLVAATLARHFNQPHALAEIGFPSKWQPELIKKKLRKMKAGGQTIFNAAYMVRGIGAIDKTEMVVTNICQPLVEKRVRVDSSSMQKSVEGLLPYWGFSDFMAGQVVADLRWAIEGGWEDRLDWAPIGPGSRRGMNRLLGRDPRFAMHPTFFLEQLQEVMRIAKKKVPKVVCGRLEAHDYQNCLCEFDKYTRTLLGEGRPKQLYMGRN